LGDFQKAVYTLSGQYATQIFAVLSQLWVTIGIHIVLKTFLKTLAGVLGTDKLLRTPPNSIKSIYAKSS